MITEHFRNGTRYRAAESSNPAPVAETHEILQAYFALLWCFERILIGRRSLTKQQNWNDIASAVAFLDDLLAWHLKCWIERWPTIRAALKAPGRVPDLRDHDSLSSFCALADEVTGPNEHTALLRTLIRQDSGARVST
ncbi:hypothetical protein [Streptomyces sp. c-19]|uniref:hypothetical protein n=1 Tax=Streptomyces sp. c-19 TaxID=2789275 RepID=UPI003980290D